MPILPGSGEPPTDPLAYIVLVVTMVVAAALYLGYKNRDEIQKKLGFT